MAVVVKGRKILFGNVPLLIEGFTIVTSPEDWVQAIGYGKRFFVEEKDDHFAMLPNVGGKLGDREEVIRVTKGDSAKLQGD
jgi:hypothetical protein